MKLVHIRTPFFKAGYKYGWMGNPVGIGIKIGLIRSNTTLAIRVGNYPKTYFLNCKEAFDFITSHQSFFGAKKGINLGVIPLTLLKDEEATELTEWLNTPE